jgi:hypothetical protein
MLLDKADTTDGAGGTHKQATIGSLAAAVTSSILPSITSANVGQSLVVNAAGTAYVANASSLSFRNKIINGDFSVDQANSGAVVTVDGAYPADRFQAYFYGTGSARQVAFSNPAAIAGFTHFISFVRTATGSNFSSFVTQIANAKVLAGQQMILSMYVRADVINAAGFAVLAYAAKDDGTFIAYSPSTPTTVPLTSVWTLVTMRLDMPVISVDPGAKGGKVVINLRCSSATENFNLQTTGWQWEIGTVKSPFEFLPEDYKIRQCQRFYCIASSMQFSAYSTAGYAISSFVPFPVKMAGIPTIVANGGSLYNSTAVSVQGASENGFNFTAVATATGQTLIGNGVSASYTARVEL